MPHFLQAGPVQVRYEAGFLRYFTVGDAEILRMIYVAIRDHNWLTAALTITDEVIEQIADSFQINYNWHTDDLGIRLAGHVAIQGDAAGTITFDFWAKALNVFQKNRLGLCILHPIEGVLGQPVELVAPDGHISSDHFPTLISPNQPFLDIQTMRWQPASGSTWQLDFSGDIFETEDQRNWTDASFKTYSTPLTIPFPVTVQAGAEFYQQVVFSQASQTLATPTPVSNPLQTDSETKPGRPRIGVGQRADGPSLTASEVALLRKLDLSHLRADVFFSLPDWQTLLIRAIADAEQLAIPLELAVFFGEDSTKELKELLDFFNHQSTTVRSILLFNAATITTSDALLQTLVPMLRTEWHDVSIGGGTDDNFAQWNQNPFDTGLVDFVSYSINPQVHASDDLTLLENIAGQAETVATARQLSGGRPIHISPVTLRPRFTTVSGTATERLTVHTDPRQATEFGADWTRQSLNTLANAGVESITYYQSHGSAGLVNDGVPYPLFSAFESR